MPQGGGDFSPVHPVPVSGGTARIGNIYSGQELADGLPVALGGAEDSALHLAVSLRSEVTGEEQ